MKLIIEGITTEECAHIWAGQPDANGQPALMSLADGQGNPCRHCLQLIEEGQPKLVLAFRPFRAPQPYAEIGPIFLHARPCVRYSSDELPGWMHYLDPAIVRGYGQDDWIRYETGKVVRGPELSGACKEILSNPQVSYVHIRSKFNCFQCRVDRS
jgi:hypothetical protein